MLDERPPPDSAAEDLARECLYRFLSAVVGGPYSAGWDRVLDAPGLRLAIDAEDLIRGGEGAEALGIARLVEALNEPPDALRAEYDRVFGLVVPKDCPPYETEYYPTAETFARSQQMADVAGFYRAFGIEPSRASPERPDHLALELEFMAFLLMKQRMASAVVNHGSDADEQVGVCERAQRDFFRDHLAWWVLSFAAGLRRRARGGYHDALARVLAVWVPAECRRLGIAAVLRPARPDLIETPEEQSGCASCPLHL